MGEIVDEKGKVIAMNEINYMPDVQPSTVNGEQLTFDFGEYIPEVKPSKVYAQLEQMNYYRIVRTLIRRVQLLESWLAMICDSQSHDGAKLMAYKALGFSREMDRELYDVYIEENKEYL